MEIISLTRVVFIVFLSICSADLSTDDLYDIIASKFDNVYFDIRNIRNDIKEITEKIEAKEQSGTSDKCEDLRTMLEKIKLETDAKLSTMEEKMLKEITNDLARVENGEGDMGDKVEKNLHILRSAVTDGKRYVHDLVNSFESRVEYVEQKILDYENASRKGVKGETGSIGPRGFPGPQGRDGNDGEKGETGSIGPRGFPGQQGRDGNDGEKGETGSNGPRGVPGTQGRDGETGKLGPRGYTGRQGQKGQKGEEGKFDINLLFRDK